MGDGVYSAIPHMWRLRAGRSILQKCGSDGIQSRLHLRNLNLAALASPDPAIQRSQERRSGVSRIGNVVRIVGP